MMQIEKLNLDWKYDLTPIKKVEKIVLHHPAHSTWSAQEIHDYHKRDKVDGGRGWNGAGYNYFITKDGQAQELRGKHVGAHVKGHNSNTLGISFQGHFDNEKMGRAQINAGAWLISQLVSEYGLTLNDVIGHRDLAATSCPGSLFPMDEIKGKALEFINPNTKKKNDDITGHWAEGSIKKALNKGIVKGYKNGLFGPDDQVTRGQLMVILDRLGVLD